MTPALPTRIRASADWQASYADPIRVARGDALHLTGRRDIWDGHRWLWAEAHGRAGWIPDDLPDGAPPTASRDYSAVELSCSAGDGLTLLALSHGWGWCRNGQGAEGWIPLHCLSLPVA